MAARAHLTAQQARAVTLRAQGLDRPECRAAGPSGAAALRRLVNRLGLIQIDSVNVLARAHYLPAFSRMGAYRTADLDQLSGSGPRSLFEYWGHEASLMPVQAHPVLRWRMAEGHAWVGPTRTAAEQPELVRQVLTTLREGGPMTTAEVEERLRFEGPRRQDYGWGWNWSDVKRILEHLFWTGEVSSAYRDATFQRHYDLAERVIPAAVLAQPTPDRCDAVRELVRTAARATGVATVSDLRDYFRLPAADTRTAVSELVEAGELLPVAVPGWPPAFLHAGSVVPRKPPQASALLSPFDPLVWHRDRAERLFGMRYRIGIYTPAKKRERGYYPLPFLHGDALVAQVDLKSDRRGGRLLVQGAWSEPTAPGPGRSGSEVAGALAARLIGTAAWLGLADVSVAPVGDLAPSLAAELRSAGPSAPG